MKVIFRTKDNKEFEDRQEAIYHEWRLIEDGFKRVGISAEQSILLEVIKLCNFNGFDGTRIVEFLYKNKERWVSVIPNLDEYTLRDLPGQCMFFDTITIKPVGEGKEFLKLIKEQIYPDEASIENGLIELWWD